MTSTLPEPIQSQEEIQRIQTCRMQAAIACDLLRKQLARQEMERRLRYEQLGGIRFDYNTGIVYQLPKEEFVLSTKAEYNKFRDENQHRIPDRPHYLT